MRLVRPLVAGLVVILAAGCSGVPTSSTPQEGPTTREGSTTGEAPTTGGASTGEAACPRRARGDQGVIARARVPADPRRLSPALLCRYRHTSDGLVLVGERGLDLRTAARLYEAFTHRSRAMVDCGLRPAKPLYAVLDRDAEGDRRVVTVDLGFCGSVAAEVAGQQLWGLATGAHRRLLAEAWGTR